MYRAGQLSTPGGGDNTELSKRLRTAIQTARQRICQRVHPRTLKRWYQTWIQFGLTPVEKQKIEHSDPEFRPDEEAQGGGRQQQAWDIEDTRALSRIIDEHPELYLDEIRDELETATGNRWSTATVWNRLFSSCGYCVHAAAMRATLESNEERARFLQIVKSMFDHPKELIFVGQTSNKYNSSRHRRSWPARPMPRNDDSNDHDQGSSCSRLFRDAYFDGMPDNGMRYTLLAAADVDGFVMGACSMVRQQESPDDDDLSHGYVDQSCVRQWIRDTLLPVLGNRVLSESRCLVILDCEFDEEVNRLIESKRGAQWLYLPSHSPDLNPLQSMLHAYKTFVCGEEGRRCFLQPSRDDWLAAHFNALSSVKPPMAQMFFKNCQVPYCDHFKTQEQQQEEEETELVAAAVAAFVTTMAAVVSARGIAALRNHNSET